MTRRKIEVLPENLANKIAAGEVIQRPESAVKELLENSLDAGATEIVLVIKEGGASLIQVSDNGIGMDEADAVASFLRHATSKITSYEELEAVRTFGFRGEALASIASVAQVTMLTRRREDDAAVVVKIEGGHPPRVSREAREPGTTVTIQNLFYNVPARRKFLKSANTEYRHVYEAVHRVAISHPEKAIKFVSDDEVIFDLRPATLDQRLVDVFGERQFSGMIPVAEETDFATMKGYIGKPSFGQKTRANQFLFLNNRYIISRTINHAVFSAYEHLLLKGTFPFFLLFLEIDPHKVDVNVHPSKMEAKFDDEQSLHRLVGALVRKGLSGSANVPAMSMRGDDRDGTVSLSFTSRQHLWPEPGRAEAAWEFPPRPIVDESTGEIFAGAGADLANRLLRHDTDRPESPNTALIWQLHNKYILSQIKNGLMIVDQHVAHERILYEKALERFENRMHAAQQLLFPYTIQLPSPDYKLVEELLPHFTLLGFDITLFGKNTIVLEGVPPDARAGNEEQIVQDMLALYKEYQQKTPLEVRDNLAKSYSCRSAIKAGDSLTEQEMRALIDQLFATRVPYVCPHGRPIVLRISIEELDRRFGRL